MGNDMTVFEQKTSAVSTVFAGQKAENELAAGIQASYGVVGYKGKVWSMRYRGEETKLMRDDGDGPRGSIEVVILKAPAHLSKIYYANGYQEGSKEAPDCFSNNGVTPDASSRSKQSTTCATCKHNVWGSAVTPAGKKTKACGDSKRIAVVPLNDIENKVFGGPMLLRVPAGSLQEIASYGNKMQGLGYPYYSIGTRVSFDPASAHPKFQFGAIRPLTDDEARLVLELRDSAQVERVLAEAADHTDAPAPSQSEQVAAAFEQPPAQAAAPAKAPTPTPTSVKTADMKAPAPALGDELDSMMDKLMPAD